MNPATAKWWEEANYRRHLLLNAKHQGWPLTHEEQRELEILQKLAEMVVDNADLFQPNEPHGL